MQASLHSNEMMFFFSSTPPFVVVVYIFHYVLSSFHAGPWITAHSEKIDIECQTFQALEKRIYPATCEPSVEVVVANVTVKGIWQEGFLMEAMSAVWRAGHADASQSEDTVSWRTSTLIGATLKVLKNSKTSASL